jgi:hypothetical protein
MPPQDPQQPGQQGLMMSAMNSLTTQLQQLNSHMRDADKAAQQRARQVTNDASVAARSQVNVPNLPGAVLLGGGQPSTSASTPDKVNQTTSDVAARQALVQQQTQPQNVDESVPPGTTAPSVYKLTHGGLNSQSDQDALTFALLGQHGGPFGKYTLENYALQRNLGWFRGVASAGADALDIRAANNLAEGKSAGTFNTLGSTVASNASNALGWLQGKGAKTAFGALLAYRGAETIANAFANTNDAGRALGYGNAQNLGIFGFRNPLAQLSATGEAASLKLEEQGLMGRVPNAFGVHGAGLSSAGLTKDQAQAAVGTLAGQGFSNASTDPRNFASGDNTRIAQNLLAPLMNMGLTAQDAAQWTPALRNANTSMQTLMDTLNQLPAAARASKTTVADFNASLEQLAQTQVSQGGTMQGGLQTGMAFTESTGMAPGIANALSQNSIYTALMMGQYGILPSGVANLPGGAQVGGMLSAFNLLRNATSGLNQNKYETVAGQKLPEVYGYQLQDAQIAQMLGVDQSTVNRLRREAPYASRISSVLGQLGNEGSNGMPGTGIWSILGKAQNWQGLNAQQQRQATSVWNATAGKNLNQLGLTSQQIKDINSTGDIRSRMSKLQNDLLGSQKNNPQNQITVYVKFKGEAAKHFTQAGPAVAKLQANSGQGAALNSVYNSPLGDASAANQTFGMGPDMTAGSLEQALGIDSSGQPLGTYGAGP